MNLINFIPLHLYLHPRFGLCSRRRVMSGSTTIFRGISLTESS